MRIAQLAIFGVGLVAAAAIAKPASPSYKIVDRIAGPDGNWDLLSVDPANHRLYIGRGEAVTAIDLSTKTVVPALIPLHRGHDALAIPGTGDVIATSGADNTAIIFDGSTGKIRATVKTGTKPDAVVFDPLTKTIWVMNPGSGDVTVIDPRTANVIATVVVGGSLELGAADGNGLIFVNVEDRNDVAVLDTRARKLVRRFPLKGCDGPTGLAFAPDKHLLISACANGIAAISAPDGRQIAQLPVGPRPDGALYDPVRKLAFVPSGGNGTLSVRTQKLSVP